jgi:hypothetical protein
MGADPQRTGFGCGPLLRRAAAARRGTGGRRAGPSHGFKTCDSARLPVHDGTTATAATAATSEARRGHDAMAPWYNDDSDCGTHGTSSSGPHASAASGSGSSRLVTHGVGSRRDTHRLSATVSNSLEACIRRVIAMTCSLD